MDRGAGHQLEDVRGCSYGPWVRAIEGIFKEEKFHIRHGEYWVKRLAEDEKTHDEAQATFAKWYIRTMNIFGRPGSAKNALYRKYRLKLRDNDEVRQAFAAEVKDKAEAVGLTPPEWAPVWERLPEEAQIPGCGARDAAGAGDGPPSRRLRRGRHLHRFRSAVAVRRASHRQATHDVSRPVGGVPRGARRSAGAGGGPVARARPRHPRHHPRLQHRDRAQGPRRRAGHHTGLSRRPDHRPREALPGLRPADRQAGAPRPALADPRSHRAHAGRRRRARAAGRGRRAPGGARARWPRGPERRRLPAP